LAIVLVMPGAQGANGDKRAPLKGVSAIRAANYGSPSRLYKERDEVEGVVSELNELRAKPWRRGEARLTCYSTVYLLAGEKTVALFRVRPDRVVEVPVEKGEPGYNLATTETDLPKLRKLLEESPPARCR
jgi:hypothetical protein